MGATRLNKQQESAANMGRKDILVSASAGTGKTTTLCIRILNRVMSGDLSLDRVLVSTFTEESAADLRRKMNETLRSALEKEEDPDVKKLLRKQLRLLPIAAIGTIDSFCNRIVRTNFDRLGLSPRMRVPDRSEIGRIKERVMKAVINENYAKDSGAFEQLTDAFLSGYSDTDLALKFIGMYESLAILSDGKDALLRFAKDRREAAELPFAQGKFGQYIADKNAERIRFLKSEYERYLDHLYSLPKLNGWMRSCGTPTCELEIKYLEKMGSAVSDPEAMNGVYDEYNAEKAELRKQKLAYQLRTDETCDEYDRVRAVWNGNDAMVKNGKYLINGFAVSGREEYLRLEASMLEQLHALFTEYETRLYDRKKELGLIEFIDMELYTRNLFYDADGRKSDFAESLANEYDEIYIDEYQDVNELQNSIFRALDRQNVFVVGDVKQSIYGFRGACPAIFSDLRRTYPDYNPDDPDKDCARVFFTDNYRCNKGIVDLVNETARNTLGLCKDMEYYDGDDLICRAQGERLAPAVILISGLFDPDAVFGDDRGEPCGQEEQPEKKSARMTDDEAEALCMARSVSSLLSSGEYKGSDIAVLVRDMTGAARIREALERENVPVSILCHKDFFEMPEILLMRSLLEAIDDPTKDIGLAAAMKSPVFGFTLERLAEIGRSGNTAGSSRRRTVCLRQKVKNRSESGDTDCGKVIAFLEEYRHCAKEMTAPELVYRLIDRFRLIPLLSYGETGARAAEIKDNLLFFYDLSRSVSDGNSGDLSAVLERISRMAENDDIGKTGGEASEERVRVMTIHGSKGLEFKVCWLFGTNKATGGPGGRTVISDEFGPRMQIGDPTYPNVGVVTEADIAVEEAARDKERDEELRLLYVAMTRAKERLYISATLPGVTGKKHEERVKNRGKSVDALRAVGLPEHCRPMLDCLSSEIKLLMFGIEGKTDGGLFELYVDDLPEELKKGKRRSEQTVTGTPDPALVEEFKRRLAFCYPHRYLTELPAKKAVSALSPTVLDEDGEPIDLLTGDREKDLEAICTETPAFILRKEGKDAANAAERGTATHAFMQFCSFENLEKVGVDAELRRLVDERFLSKEIADLVNKAQITAFLHSDLFVELKKAMTAEKLRREQRFMIPLPAKDFTEDDGRREELEKESLLVQGVIDGFYEDEKGGIVLFDYKTDRFGGLEKKDPAACERILRERHRDQLRYYEIAIEMMTGKKVTKSLIYSFSLGKAIPV